MRKRLGHHTKPLGDHQSQLHQEQAPRRLWSRNLLGQSDDSSMTFDVSLWPKCHHGGSRTFIRHAN